MTLAAAVAVAVFSLHISAAPSRDALAADYGKTMHEIDVLRAQARYNDAVDELRGLMARFDASGVGIGSTEFLYEMARLRELMRELVELEELIQRADDDPRAARRMLRILISPAQAESRTAEQARALRMLGKHDAKVQRLLDEAFPARVVVEVSGIAENTDIVAFPFENAIVEMSVDALPVTRYAGASTLHVKIDMRENDTNGNSILAGTLMKSYAMTMSALVEGADGDTLAKAATTTAVLGINPGNATKHGMQKCARVIYSVVVDEIAKRAALE